MGAHRGRVALQYMHWGGGRTLTGAVRTHHGGLVLVDHHFFSFRNYADARDKTRNSKAAEVLMMSCLRGLGGGGGHRGGLSKRNKNEVWAKKSPPQQSGDQ